MNLLSTRAARTGAAATVLALAGAALSIAPANAGVPTSPSAPQNVHAVQSGLHSVTMTWDPSASSGSYPIDSYLVGYSTGQSGNGQAAPADATSSTLTGIPANTRYTYSVTAHSTDGTNDYYSDRVEVPLTVRSAPTVSANHAILTAGSTETLSGTWYTGTTVTIQRALPGKPYADLDTVDVDANGHYSDAFVVSRTATYRVKPAHGSISGTAKVAVKSRLTLDTNRTAVHTFVLSGTVYPVLDGQAVTISQRKADGTYFVIGTAHATAAGKYGFKHTFAGAPSYIVKASTAANTRNAGGSVVTEFDNY